MKTILTCLSLLITSISSGHAYFHKFDGVSEVYNIRNLRVLAKFLPNEPIVIEAGAYCGRDTIKLAKGFPLAQIFAFEPLSTGFAQLSGAVRPYSNVTPINMALDKVSGTSKFYICHGTYGESPVFEFHSSLLKPAGSSAIHLQGPIVPVACTSIRDFCTESSVDKIDMLWLSTEGNELQVLKGAQDLLNQTTLVYVRTQLYPTRESITLFKDLKKFMEKRGFILLSHLYIENANGDALFIKKEAFTE